jgi:hypothetical protein
MTERWIMKTVEDIISKEIRDAFAHPDRDEREYFIRRALRKR